MTTAALPRLHTGTSHHSPREIAVAFFEGIVEGRQMEMRYERLRRMSNAELARQARRLFRSQTSPVPVPVYVT